MLQEETISNNRQRAPHSTRHRIQSKYHPSTSPSKRKTSPATPKRHRPPPKPVEVFHKCYSEPMIFPATVDGGGLGGDGRCLDSDEGGWFGRVNTSDDIMFCTDSSDIIYSSPLSRINSGYQKDAKVVITVTVEGSPGPVRTLVKLGANVEDAIKLVVQRYGEEGRTPHLDKNSASSFELHVSYFSLQSLDRSYVIGDVGTRSFYLRKSRKKSYGCNIMDVATTSLPSSPGKHSNSPVLVLSSFIARKLNKFVRRVHKLFIFLGCLHSR